VKCGTCCGLEILASVDDGNGINIFYIDHIRAVLHNQKLKEQAKNSSGDFINEENGSEYSYCEYITLLGVNNYYPKI
jgi:hypothetical protein